MNETRKAIESYEVVDHGIEHEQYFHGCGLAFTEYTDVATGIGDDAQEALEDALESLAQNDWDVESINVGDELVELDHDSSVGQLVADADEHESYDEHHYYVSVRVR